MLLLGLVLASFGAQPALAQVPVSVTPIELSLATITPTEPQPTPTSSPAVPETATPTLEVINATPTEILATPEPPTPTPTSTLPEVASPTPTELPAVTETGSPVPTEATPTAESATPVKPSLLQAAAAPSGNPILSDGQFVYGPNVGSFNVVDYMNSHTPQLTQYTETLYGRAEYYSINPKVYLTLIEMAGGLVSNTAATSEQVENPFGLSESGFTAQLDAISNTLFDTYYLHLYNYSILPPEARALPALTLKDGSTLAVPGEYGAGSYAVMAILAKFLDANGIISALDNRNSSGFVQTYQRLFPGDSPLSEGNQVGIPGEVNAQSAPPGLLQLPYARGSAWIFGGLHSDNGSSSAPLSSIDFSPDWGLHWGANTSNYWVVAAAKGTPHKISSCQVRIKHSGGWETSFYHLGNVQPFGTSINQNDHIANIASTESQATCNGGSATSPHVHFGLMYNGAYVSINGTALSGWVIHGGGNYQSDQAHMWLERDGVKKYAWVDPLLNDTNTCISPVTLAPTDDELVTNPLVNFSWNTVSNCSYNGYDFRIKDVSDMEAGGNTIVDTIVSSTTHEETIPSTWYAKELYWGLRPANANLTTYWTVHSFTVIPPPPAPELGSPADSTTIERTASTTLTWNAVTGATRYYAEFSGGSSINLNSGWITGLKYIVGVRPGGSYTWRVKARNLGGEGPWSPSRTLVVKFGAPGSLTATTSSQTLIKLAWVKSADAPSYIDGYRIYRNDAPVTTVPASATSYSDSGLPCGTSNSYIIKAYKGEVESPASNTVARATYACTPPPPTLLNPADSTVIYSKTINFTWQSPNSPAQNGYTLRISVSPNPLTTPFLVNKHLTNSSVSYSYTFITDRVYYWHMRTWNIDNFSSGWVSRPFTVHGTPPGTPVLRTPAKNALLTNYTPTLDWNDATDVDHYQIQIATISNFSTPLVYDENDVTSSTWTVPPASPLPANDKYYWRVRSINEHGVSSIWSPVYYFRTALTPPVLLDPANESTALTTRPIFTWNGVSGASSYVIQVSINSTFRPLLVNASAIPASYTPKVDLPRNKILYWRVYARGANPSAWSAPFNFTSADPPSIPGLLLPAKNILLTNYQPTLDWNDVAGAVSYAIQVATSSALLPGSIITETGSSDYSYKTDLAPNTTYYWRARSYNNKNQYSLWSASRYFRTALTPPVLVSPSNNGQALTTRPTFSWNVVNGASSYALQVSTSPSFRPLLLNISTTSLLFTVTSDLPRATNLYWRVYARGANPSSWSVPNGFTSADPPPISILASPVSGAAVASLTPKLDWNDTTPLADHYQIQISTSSSFSTLVYDEKHVPNSEFLVPSALLNHNKKYYWRVSTYAANGQYSLWSAARYFRTPLPAPLLLAPVVGTIATTLRPVFDWSDVSGATGYTFQVSTVSDFSTRLISTTTTHSTYKPSINLPQGVTLYWRVKVRATNPSDWAVGSFSIP